VSIERFINILLTIVIQKFDVVGIIIVKLDGVTGPELADDETGDVLHQIEKASLEAALEKRLSVVMADTHLTRPVFERELGIVVQHGLTVEWKVFDVPWGADGPQ
jgi:hypothetical protein